MNLPLMEYSRSAVLIFSFCLVQIGILAQGNTQNNRIWGYSFGDLIYKAQGDTLYWGNTEYAGVEKKAVGTNLRRLFIGYDTKISDGLKARVLVESKATTTTKEGRFGLAVIHGYLEMENILPAVPNSRARLGLIPTPNFALPEKTWGYRSVEKDALDLRGIGKVIDQGASFSGDFNKDKTAGFSVMVGNGTGNRPGVDKYLEYYASVYKKLWKNQLTLELLCDYARRSPNSHQAFARSFISVEKPKWTLGAEFTHIFTKEDVSGKLTEVNPFSISLFLANKLGFLGENWRSFLRYDFYDPATKYQPDGVYGSPSQHYDEHSYWLGLHYKLRERVHFMPNLIINQYKPKNKEVVERKSDVVPRFTVYFQFGD